jgi:phosphoketolase
LEQGRNGWTHQRPEIEAYFAAMMRNGNVFPLFPPDANSIQVCYDWALSTQNKGIVITASKSPLPIRTTFEQTRQALQDGAVVLQESSGTKTVAFAVIGDLVLIPVYEAAKQLAAAGFGVRIASVVNPRRLYRSSDVAWELCAEADGGFLDDSGFDRLFGGEALIGVAGGASAMLEPIMLRSSAKRDTFAWKRGETTASANELLQLNGITPEALAKRAIELLG